MNVGVDSNMLLRYVQQGHAQQLVAQAAMAELRARGWILCVLPQCFYEFWVVFTRPVSANGLGRSISDAINTLAQLRLMFTLLPDNDRIFPEWKRLVATHAVIGKPAHDARIAAAMSVHGVTHLLTFNTADFARYPGVVALDPHAVAAGNVP